jgi:hypothetical protein
MLSTIRRILAVILCMATVAYAQGNSWKVRYNGGSVESKVDKDNWGNKLTITADAITLELKDKQKQKVTIAPNAVTSLSYGQEAHRRVGTMIALAVLVAPVALFGLFHKTRLHYIGIQYTTPDGKNAGILLQGDKDNYRAILVALQGVTGAPVSVGEKEREFVPVGVKTAVSTNLSDAREPSKATASVPSATGSIEVRTTPDGADVFVDEQFYGNSPVILKLKPGKHTVRIKMSGFQDWSRDVSTETGTEAHLNAVLEKSS